MSDVIVFDNETTGFTLVDAAPLSKQPKMIEFAAIRFDDKLNEIDRIEFLVQPGCKLPDKIIEVTGITDDTLKDAKPFAAHYNDMAKFFLGAGAMAAHNMPFDQAIIKYELMRIGKEFNFPWPIRHICTVAETHGIHGYRLKLSALHELATGKTFTGAHRAMADTEALVRCFKWIVKEKYIQL